MLTFYYHPLSPIARRVWLALLEKALPFEPVIVNLTGEQFQADFLAISPFHHVPVLIDDGQRILESLAILTYLEAQYPTLSLSPSEPRAIARMSMVQMVTVNELTTKLPALVLASEASGFDEPLSQHLATVLSFLDQQLGGATFFGGDRLSLADITAGATFPLLKRLGVEWQTYPAIAAWFERITARPAWQQTEPDEADFAIWKRWILLMIKRRQRQLART
ncbi:MAG: glutathione S-transferase family protein [Leptolyngbya sp. SIO4C5]|nr:glutathione S-transferase family protein [Leptolyngbya sp. SIO4C5]